MISRAKGVLGLVEPVAWTQVARRAAPFLGYLLLQAFIVVGLRTPRFPDSRTYTVLSLTGRAQRLPTVPLLYTLFPGDSLRICAQVVLAALSWWLLARIASGIVVHRWVRLGLRLTLLALGLVGPVASWNSTILSESVAISLTALLVAVWLRYARHESWPTAAAALGVTVLWMFTRQSNVVLGLLIAAIALLALWRRPSNVRVVVAVALVVATAAGIAATERNQSISNTNVATIIQNEVLPNPSWTQWFVNHGMPYSTGLAEDAGRWPATPIQADPEFNAWLTSRGLHTYLEFALEHPVYTFVDPLPYFSGEEASLTKPNHSIFAASTQPEPTPSFLSPTADDGRHRDVLPTVVQGLLFEQGQIGAVLTLAALAIGLAVVSRRRWGSDRRLWVPALVAASAIPQAYLVWLGSGLRRRARSALDRPRRVVAHCALDHRCVCARSDRQLAPGHQFGANKRSRSGALTPCGILHIWGSCVCLLLCQWLRL